MRRILGVAIIILSAFPLSTFAANGTDRSDLLKTREAVWRAWFANDGKALDDLLPADTITISSGEEQWKNKAQVLEEAVQFQRDGGKLISLEFPRTEVQRYGNVAIIYSQYRYAIEVGGKPSQASGRVTEIFVFRQGKWFNSGWHTDREK